MPDTAESIALWLAEEFGHSFTSIMETMAEQKPETSCDGMETTCEPSEGALNFIQPFSIGPACTISASVPEPVWQEAGGRVLKAAGIDEVSRDDALNTFKEVLSQALSGIATVLTGKLSQEVTCPPRLDDQDLPADAIGMMVSVTFPESELAESAIFFYASPELIEAILNPAPLEDEEPAASAPAARAAASAAPGSSMSKTFDLLLGVHLPVSVSFGKTTMMVKEVLKLTTGSIVELNRMVSEPVDIIVNNCIIARGEVVVVSGNYGVRVREIVSREERYETGIKSASMLAR